MQTYEEQCKHLELELKALKEAYGNLEYVVFVFLRLKDLDSVNCTTCG